MKKNQTNSGIADETSSYLENLILKNAKRNREIEIETPDLFPVITDRELEILASVKRVRVRKAKLEHSS